MGEETQSDRARRFLNEHLGSRQVNKILHGFPSPRFWQERAVPVDDILTARRNRADDGEFHLYMGVPYCIPTNPGKCGYCLFPVEDFAGSRQLDDYLDLLEREGEMYRPLFEGVIPQSVYIGGGTPNLLKADQYPRLMAILRRVFPNLPDSTCITLEGIPPLFSQEKLRVMKEHGIGRISMGVQQFNTELNALSGRRQTVEHTLDAIQWCQELGLDCNIDLIFGWPRQTMDTMIADLERAVATGVDHLTHYELNVGGATDFALNHRDELPSPAECKAMYHASRELLTRSGFRQLTAYDFERKRTRDDDAYVYEECERDWRCHETWGWGFAGISNFESSDEDESSWTYVNFRSIRDYADCVHRGELPVERGFRRGPSDHRLDQLFRHLQCRVVDRGAYESRFGTDVVEEHEPVWLALGERGLAVWSDTRIELTPEGMYHTPLVQTVLAQDRIAALQERGFQRMIADGINQPKLTVLDGSADARS